MAKTEYVTDEQVNALRDIANVCYQCSVENHWWHDLETGQKLDRDRLNMLCLIHSEISEACEGERKGCMDDHLPHRSMTEVELADALIRIFDYASGHGYDVAGALQEKLRYNMSREDHKPENRKKEGGKKY